MPALKSTSARFHSSFGISGFLERWIVEWYPDVSMDIRRIVLDSIMGYLPDLERRSIVSEYVNLRRHVLLRGVNSIPIPFVAGFVKIHSS